ncbi:MAG: cobalt ECF transporter T component CbiQ [Deltaproteobacteria bacterium]|nr:cobalt ECF transporter T component CbiQ [Deltaproteobacteria bacterium]
MIDEGFTHGNSIIHRLDPRVRVVVAGLYSVLVAFSDRFPALATALLIALILVPFAMLPFKKIVSRLLIVNIMILLVWILVPFTFKGEPFFNIGPLVITKEGIIQAGLITVKSNSIILVLMTLVATMPVFTMGRTMRYLHVPAKIVHLFLFTYRYIHAIHREYSRQVNAIKIRGFQPGTNAHTYRTYAYMVGMLLVRSHDRAERVRAAMLCRGFKGEFYDMVEFSFRPFDLIAMMLMILAVFIIGLLQWTTIIY